MKMNRIKGRVQEIESDSVLVFSEGDAESYRFPKMKFLAVEEGDKVDVLFSGDISSFSTIDVLSVKSKKKAKPIKMPGFTTLVGHMIKTRERLQATLEIAKDSDRDEIIEKITWLDRGINMFS